MTASRSFLFVLFATLFLNLSQGGPAAARAWGSPGHQTVGAIADRYIANTNAATQVKAILGPGMNLQIAAVWADCAKGVSKNKNDGTFSYGVNSRYKECLPFETTAGKALMVDFVKRNWEDCKPAADEEPCHKQYHYTDVAIERDAYKKGLVGTSDHDIVSAINAAIIVLQGGTSPAPFNIANKKEALLLLAHYVGDLHQPLHVVAVYLDANGKVVDPDTGTFNPDTKTRGGNRIEDGSIALHKEWDTIPTTLNADHLTQARIAAARNVALTTGSLSDWSTAWATDTLQVGKPAFKNLKYAKEDSKHQWQVTLPAGYSKLRTDMQRQQLIKAGARLGQILESIWP
jgi:hypothetical protein